MSVTWPIVVMRAKANRRRHRATSATVAITLVRANSGGAHQSVNPRYIPGVPCLAARKTTPATDKCQTSVSPHY